jgi:hypothetical protein
MFSETCVSTLEPKCYDSYTQHEDVLDYFSQVLALRAQYDLFSAFSNANITPGGFYSLVDMQNAIENAFGVTAKFDCKSGTLTNIEMKFSHQGTSTYMPQDMSGSTALTPWISHLNNERMR